MFDLHVSLINGMCVGIDFPSPQDVAEDCTFVMMIDVFIIRIVLARFNNA